MLQNDSQRGNTWEMKTGLLHPTYLPFSEEQLRSHFAQVRNGRKCVFSDSANIEYYTASIQRYEAFTGIHPDRCGLSINHLRYPCQIEKDERFWIASSMMTLFHSEARIQSFTKLLSSAFGPAPPFKSVTSWHECLTGDLHLFFEVNLPSPKVYKEWLLRNLKMRHFVPYVLHSAHGKTVLEGPTNVDALLLNATNGFSVVAEAKVLSDISYAITYDMMRNQIARNIDVMLESNVALCDPLNRRDPDLTLFLLITPKVFKKEPGTRLYQFKMKEYQCTPSLLGDDLRHRENTDWKALSRRVGWTTWEDMNSVNQDCCPWI